MANTALSSILFIARVGMWYFDGTTGGIFHMAFTPDAVRDMEVLNREQFTNQISTFIERQQFTPNIGAIVMAEDVLFYKFVPVGQDVPDPEPDTKEFLSHVPFEFVGQVSVPQANGVLVVATNEDLYIHLKRQFEKKGWSVPFILPAIVFDLSSFGTPFAFTTHSASAVLAQAPALSPYSLVYEAPEEIIVESEQTEGEKAPEKKKKPVEVAEEKRKTKRNLKVMVPVFGVLIGILSVLVISQQQQSRSLATTRASAATSTPVRAPTAAPVPDANTTPVVTKAATKEQLAQTTIQVVAPASSLAVGAQLKEFLVAKGLEKVEVLEQAALSTSQTLVLIDSRVDEAVKSVVMQAINEKMGAHTIQQADGAAVDITIIIPK